MDQQILAWHFVGDELRDGRPVPADGETLRHDGELLICKAGLHASLRLIDALRYAPGNAICRVKCGGKIIYAEDKLVCSERTIIWRVEGGAILRRFARECALSVAQNWDCPDVVMRWLAEGDENLRAEACSAAWSAAWSSAESAVWSAACAAESAVWSAARNAARSAACAARSAARNAARSAALSAARTRQDLLLTQMVIDERDRQPISKAVSCPSCHTSIEVAHCYKCGCDLRLG